MLKFIVCKLQFALDKSDKSDKSTADIKLRLEWNLSKSHQDCLSYVQLNTQIQKIIQKIIQNGSKIATVSLIWVKIDVWLLSVRFNNFNN
ncbi:hypothetical protein A9Z63_10990 [Moraxella lacunata]|uniref:Uncharacterized protein n=1 Tax=Moraxella lacunata TaxID=477 RepID=A0A1B8Q4K1_MORLA|nr:hypothetical protein A9Z63_10990 [Moraxella lacunata]OBX64361.1 hypothetical protein A9309_04745 [Moraxella lacunata]